MRTTLSPDEDQPPGCRNSESRAITAPAPAPKPAYITGLVSRIDPRVLNLRYLPPPHNVLFALYPSDTGVILLQYLSNTRRVLRRCCRAHIVSLSVIAELRAVQIALEAKFVRRTFRCVLVIVRCGIALLFCFFDEFHRND